MSNKIQLDPGEGSTYQLPEGFGLERLAPKVEVPKYQRINDEQEILSGFVRYQKATDIEERYGRAVDENELVTGYSFQPSYVSGRNMPGEIRLDYMLYTVTGRFPVFLDGYWHTDPVSRLEDQLDAQQIDEILHGTGASPAQRIPGDQLQNMEDARRAVTRTLELYYLLHRWQ